MQYLFEYTDTIASPFEAFTFDASRASFPVHPHWHYFMEIIYMKEGQALFECDGVQYVLGKGDLIIIYPETVHAVYAVAGFPIVYDVLKFDVDILRTPNSYTPHLGAVVRAARSGGKVSVVFRDAEIRSYCVQQYFSVCIEELDRRRYGYDIIVRNQVSQLLVMIIRLWWENGFSPDTVCADPLFEQSGAALSIRSVTAYIDEHSSDDIRVEDLAGKCSMSYSFFAKKFHELYGRSCKEYLELIRVTKAEDMLLFTMRSISWIAAETGFADASHFIKTFRRWKGITPKQFRLNCRKP